MYNVQTGYDQIIFVIDEIVEIFIVTDNTILKKFPGDNFFSNVQKIPKFAIFDFIENYYVGKKKRKIKLNLLNVKF